jgi:hypothetical protein
MVKKRWLTIVLDLDLSQAKFPYNSSMNRSIGRNLFLVVYGRSLKVVVDWVKLLDIGNKISVDVSSF